MLPAPAGVMHSAEWGRLVFVRDAASAADNIRTVFAYPVAPPSQRFAAVRLDTAAVNGIASRPATARRCLDRRRTCTAKGLDGTPRRARRAAVCFSRGTQRGAGGDSGPLAITGGEDVDRVDPGTRVHGGRRVARIALPPHSIRRRRIDGCNRGECSSTETIAKADGSFEVAGLGEVDYELVAFHAQFGKAAVAIAPTQTQATIQLASAGTIRGRVVRGGRPLAGVDVVSVPDAATFNGARDMTDAKGGDARTGADGRFQVTASAAGGGELRIGGGLNAVTRIALPRPVPEAMDVGDIELEAAIEITVVLDRDPGCLVQAIGPIGKVGLQMVAASREADGGQKLRLPETGVWQFVLVCGKERHALAPNTATIDARQAGKEVRFRVADKPDAIY